MEGSEMQAKYKQKSQGRILLQQQEENHPRPLQRARLLLYRQGCASKPLVDKIKARLLW